MQKKIRSTLWGTVVSSALLLPSLQAQELATLLRQPEETSVSLQQTISLGEALNLLSQQYHITFEYNDRVISNQRVNTAALKRSGKLNKVLAELLNPLNLSFEPYSRSTYLIYPKKDSSGKKGNETAPAGEKTGSVLPDTSQSALPAMVEISVSGRVTDAVTGEGLPGVTVLVKGTTNGTTTDQNGQYKIIVPDGSALVFSFVGYTSEEQAVGSRTTIDVALAPDIRALQEVVVVGYGTQKQANLTGSVSTIMAKEVANRPLTNIANALSGSTAGVYANQTSGQPGSENVTLRVLGTGTLNNANPLVLVDGVEAPIGNINPNDVESMTVLKDAAAAAIYGSRAANGVVIVTTKKGQKGPPRFTYNTYYGITQPTNRLDMITDTPTFLEYVNESRANVGQAPLYSDQLIQNWKDSASIDPMRYPNTDWFKELFKQGHIQEHNLGVNGGSDQLLYNLSLDYLNNKGVVPTTSSNRLSVRVNLDGTISRRFKFGNNLSVIPENVQGPGNLNNVFLFMGSSDIVPKTSDGRYGGPQDGVTVQTNNGLAQLETSVLKQNRLNILNVAYLQYEIIKGLTWKTTGGIRYFQNYQNTFSYQAEYWNFRTNKIIQPKNLNGSNTVSDFYRNYQLTLFNTLNYVKTLGQHHNFNLLLGNSQESYEESNFNAGGGGIFTDATPVLSAATNNRTVGGGKQEWRMLSFFSRLNYDFKGKYLFEVNFRADGSSRFAQENRWGYFPSFSAGWRITEEPFAKIIRPVVDNLKIRASRGQLGNNATTLGNNAINNYPYQSLYSSNLNYIVGGSVVTGVGATALTNRNIQWENTTVTDIGLDADFFQNRLHLEGDYFNRITEGILYRRSIPDYIGGLTGPNVNLAEVQNKGWSVAASFQQKLTGKISIQFGGNLTHIDNKVTKFQGPDVRVPNPENGNFNIREGYPINYIFGYQAEGLFRSGDDVAGAPTHFVAANNPLLSTAAGDIRYADVDLDGKITPADRTIIGNTNPKYTYGFNFSVQGYGFDLSLLFNGVAKQDALLHESSYFQFIGPEITQHRRVNTEWLDHYTAANTGAAMPRLTPNNTGPNNWNNFASSFWVQDVSFLRLRNAQLGYTIPTNLIGRVGLKSLKVYVNAQNPLTFTKFKGLDPERPPLSTSIDFPNLKVFSAGLNAAF